MIKRKPLTKKEKSEVYDLYFNTELSQKEIAELYSVRPITISRCLPEVRSTTFLDESDPTNILKIKRICTNCKVIKPLIEFVKTKSTKYGRGHRCYPCNILQSSHSKNKLRQKNVSITYNTIEVGHQQCLTCFKTLPKISFCINRSTKNGLNYHCKKCCVNHTQKWLKTNPNYKKEYEEKTGYSKKYRKENKAKRTAASKIWRINNLEHSKSYVRKRRKEKYLTDPIFRSQELIRNSFNNLVRKNGLIKTGKTFKLLNYSPKELWDHLKTFYNTNCELCGKILITTEKLVIEHKIPIGSASSLEELIKLNQFSNLRLAHKDCNQIKILQDVIYIKEKKKLL